MDEVLQLENLYLRRGRFMVCDVNVRLAEGQVLAVCGRSGAGKSTLVRGIGGALRAQAGVIRYWGRQMYEEEARIRRQMSVVYDEPNFNTELKPERLVRELVRFEPDFRKEAFFTYMEQLELKADQRIKLYSAGMQKALMLLLALCRSPGLLVMDEPTLGVDAEIGRRMWDLICDYRGRQGLAIVYTTRHEEELRFATHVMQMNEGSCGSMQPAGKSGGGT